MPFGFLFGIFSSLRRSLYGSILSQIRAAAPVISVGNITVGGTGKTPFTILIADRLNAAGRNVAIVTRGYGRKRRDPVLVVSRGVGPELSAIDAGDEAYLISEKTRCIPVICAFDRSKGCEVALKEFGSDCIVLDDGFQHLRLARDLDIVLIDDKNPFGNGRVLPAGHLREKPEALKSAQALVRMCRWPEQPESSAKSLGLIPNDIPILSAILRPGKIRHVHEAAEMELAILSGKRVHAVSGIARPEGFERMISALGAEIVVTSRYPDHFSYTKEIAGAIMEKSVAEKVDMTITTDKDACKLSEFITKDELLVLTLEVDFAANMDKLMVMVMDAIDGRKPS
jgi:tetraacyldisaccharide 4'-kinase